MEDAYGDVTKHVTPLTYKASRQLNAYPHKTMMLFDQYTVITVAQSQSGFPLICRCEILKVNPMLKGAMSNFSEVSEQELASGTRAKLGVLEFVIALDAILDDPIGQSEKWFAGEDIFLSAWVDKKYLIQPEAFGPMKFFES